MRAWATTRKKPTPMATARIRVMLSTEGSCSASTCRSGSAMVTTTPRTKQTSSGSSTRLVLLICTPMPSPMGVMDMSTPRENSPMPNTRSIAPNRNKTMVPGVSGAMVTLMASTMAVMGRTEASDSLIFSSSSSLCCKNSKSLLCRKRAPFLSVLSSSGRMERPPAFGRPAKGQGKTDTIGKYRYNCNIDRRGKQPEKANPARTISGGWQKNAL